MVTTVTKTIGSSGNFSSLQLWEDGAPADLTTSNTWSSGSHTGTFTQGETVTGTGITGGKLLDTNNSSYITFGTTTTPSAGITVTGSSSGATCVLSGSADVGVIWRGECQNQEFVGGSPRLTVGGSTVSSTAYHHLTTVSGASFRDNAGVQTNALRYDASKGAAIRGTTSDSTILVTSGSFRLSNLQIQQASGGNATVRAGVDSNELFENLIAQGLSTGSADTDSVVYTAGTIRNSVLINLGGSNQVIGTGTLSPNFYNCTIVALIPGGLSGSGSIFKSGASGAVTVQNCIIISGNTASSIKSGSATFNFTTCYSDISGTAGVTQTDPHITFRRFQQNLYDLRLLNGAAPIDAGTADTTNAAIDIVGTPRPYGSAYDVGCWEHIPYPQPTIYTNSTPLRW